MKEIMSHWFAIAVGSYLISMVLYGHYKGAIRLAVSLVALIATSLIVNIAMPKVTALLKENTFILHMVEENTEKAIGVNGITPEKIGIPAEQRMAIDELNLPQQLKDALIENNNNEVYQMLGVDAFADYIGSYLSDVVINIIGFLLLFFLIYVILHILMRWLDIVARLPILSGLNKIAGAILGGIEGLVFFWIFCLFITAFSGTGLGISIIAQIEASNWLTFLYSNNVFSRVILGIVSGML